MDGVEVSFLKGAPEIILELCDLEPSEKGKASAEFDGWARSGLKVLALAYKQGKNTEN
jgi:magnesium-transporting ATPase (P-type)